MGWTRNQPPPSNQGEPRSVRDAYDKAQAAKAEAQRQAEREAELEASR